jgi:hypothetical protein
MALEEGRKIEPPEELAEKEGAMLGILISKMPPMPWAVGGRHLQPGVAVSVL